MSVPHLMFYTIVRLKMTLIILKGRYSKYLKLSRPEIRYDSYQYPAIETNLMHIDFLSSSQISFI